MSKSFHLNHGGFILLFIPVFQIRRLSTPSIIYLIIRDRCKEGPDNLSWLRSGSPCEGAIWFLGGFERMKLWGYIMRPIEMLSLCIWGFPCKRQSDVNTVLSEILSSPQSVPALGGNPEKPWSLLEVSMFFLNGLHFLRFFFLQFFLHIFFSFSHCNKMLSKVLKQYKGTIISRLFTSEVRRSRLSYFQIMLVSSAVWIFSWWSHEIIQLGKTNK